VAVTVVTGGGGGGAESTWESGEEQPAKASRAQAAPAEINRGADRAGAIGRGVGVLVFTLMHRQLF
jgi:hypothetical protein